MFYTFDAKSRRDSVLDVYDCAKIDYGDCSPFECPGWRVVSARIVLFTVPSKPGRSPRLRSVELKSNGHTNLREQDDTDLYVADDLLRRWGILEPNEGDDEEGCDPTSLLCSLFGYAGLDIAAHQFATANWRRSSRWAGYCRSFAPRPFSAMHATLSTLSMWSISKDGCKLYACTAAR
jgi:hypothetical protein